MEFIIPLIFCGVVIFIIWIIPAWAMNDSSGNQSSRSSSSNHTPITKATPPMRREDPRINSDASPYASMPENSFQRKYVDIKKEYDSLQQKYSLQTIKLDKMLTELESCRSAYSTSEHRCSHLRSEISQLRSELSKCQIDLSVSNSIRAELTEKLDQYCVSSFRLSDVPPEKWTLYISSKMAYNIRVHPNYIHSIVNNYLHTEATDLNAQLITTATSNLTAIPYMASIMSDYETHSLELLASQLSWGDSQERAKKVKSIREIRKDAQAMVEKNLEAKYQLEYLLNLYPNLRDVIETDYNELPTIDAAQISEYDRTRDWLSKEEYQSLSSIERNQLALDRYKESHNKTKWQIGRDYELYVGYRYTLKGYTVDTFGSYMGMEDLGRDLIAKKDGTILIVQCKYWSQMKTIHEKHINQLYGTMICYCIEHDLSPDQVKGVLVTNITLSDTAKKMAQYLHIECVENFERGDYPCIKCNIGHGEHGTEKIYHLPFDQQYDATKIDAPGEFYAMTVKEAEEAGFRRAFKWFGSD